jgi:hypothetical protein
MNKLACIVLVLSACGKKDAPPKVDITDADLAAVNAAIPADLKGKVEFEIGVVSAEKGSKTSFKMVRPKGWKGGFMPGSLEPADADNFGSKTLGKSELTVDSNCDGSCEKKDWEKVADKVNFQNYIGGKAGEGKVLKDTKGKNTRTLVYEHKLSDWPEKDVAISIVTAWWDPDGTRYFTCQAELGTPIKGLADAFEKACSKVSGD